MEKIKVITKYIIKIGISFLIYSIVMLIKRNIWPSTIIFYEGIIVAFLLFTIIIFIQNKKHVERNIISLLICVLFWSLGPTILDRSVSITVIGSLRNQPKLITELDEIFVNLYVVENLAVKKRLYEQIESGNIEKVLNGKYRLTKKGFIIAEYIELLSVLFNVNQNLIKGESNK